MGVQLDSEVKRVSSSITTGPRLAVVGSASFHDVANQALCEAIAAHLATIAELVALTGGMSGVGVTFGRSYVTTRRELGFPENLFNLLPEGAIACTSGITLVAGSSFHERREILGRISQAYLVIEGGPGTQHECTVAIARGAAVIPVGRTGGCAGELHTSMGSPPQFSAADWELLGDKSAPTGMIVAAIGRLVAAAIGQWPDKLPPA